MAAGRFGADESVDGTDALMAAPRKGRHRKGQGQIEDDLLKNARWSGLRELVQQLLKCGRDKPFLGT